MKTIFLLLLTLSTLNLSAQSKKPKVKYIFSANGGTLYFFDDNTYLSCLRCDYDSNYNKNLDLKMKRYPYKIDNKGNIITDNQIIKPAFQQQGGDFVLINYKKYYSSTK